MTKPTQERVQKSSSIRLFQNDFMEWFSHIHPLTPVLVWGPVVAFFVERSHRMLKFSWMQIGWGFLAGVGLWTWAEYGLHRFVFHFQPKGEFQKRVQFLIHGVHHADPADATRLVMAPALGAVIALGLYGVGWIIFGGRWVQPIFAGLIAGYLVYDYTHYSVHHWRQRTPWGRMLKRNHMLHHFKDHHSRWGVSSPLWDMVFGTLESKSTRNEEIQYGEKTF